MEEKSWCFPGDICDFMEAQNSKEPRRRATAPTGREMRRSALARAACLITQSVRCGAEEMRGVVRCAFIFRCYIRSFCGKSAKATPTRAQCVNVQTRGSAAASCLRAEGAVHDVRPCASFGRNRRTGFILGCVGFVHFHWAVQDSFAFHRRYRIRSVFHGGTGFVFQKSGNCS